jgi:hypothetical protein
MTPTFLGVVGDAPSLLALTRTLAPRRTTAGDEDEDEPIVRVLEATGHEALWVDDMKPFILAEKRRRQRNDSRFSILKTSVLLPPFLLRVSCSDQRKPQSGAVNRVKKK